MHLKYFSDSVPPANNAAAARADVFLNALKDANVDLEVFTSTRGSNFKALIFKPASNKSGFVVRLVLEVLVGMELSIRLLISHWRKPGTVFFSSPPFIPAALGATVARLCRIPYVFEVRDPYPEVYFQQNILSKKSILGRLLKSFVLGVYRNARHIIAVTKGIEEIVSNYSGAHDGLTKKITLVKNGYDENLFQESLAKESAFTCVFHGNLGHMQNVDLLLKVVELTSAKSPAIRFMVIGDGPQAFKLTQANGIDYLGKLPFGEIPKIVARCHLGLSFRSDGELGKIALPVKVFEYIGCGLPTIATPMSEVGELVESHRIGFQFDNDAVKVSEKICELAENPELYNQLRTNVSQQRFKFSRQAQAETFVKKITELQI